MHPGSPFRLGSAGQTILEFTLSSGLLVLVIAGGGWLFQASWNRLQCARITFESGHASLMGERGPPPQGHPLPATLKTQEDPHRVISISRCGSGDQERLSFETLESIQKRRAHGL